MDYSRQIKIFGKKGQNKLKKSEIVIVGCGGLGTNVAELLTRAGIGKINLIDRDIIENSNLQRQRLYGIKDVGKPKCKILMNYLKKINPKVKFNNFYVHLDWRNIERIIKKPSVIVDCTDNLETKFLLNEYAIKNKIPLVFASSIDSRGYVFNVLPTRGMCLRCIFKEARNLETCETSGVLNTILSLISSIQANEVIKILLKKKPEDKLIYFDIQDNKIEKIKVKKNPKCPVCNKKFYYLEGKKEKKIIKFCDSEKYLIEGDFDYSKLKRKLKKFILKEDKDFFVLKEIGIFKNKKVLIKAKSIKEAENIYSKYIGN